MEGPPTTTMYSPSFEAKALPPIRSKVTSNKESRRMKPMSRSTIYAEDENPQVVASNLWTARLRLHHAQDLPKSDVFGSVRICCRSPVPPQVTDANCNSKPLRIRRRRRS